MLDLHRPTYNGSCTVAAGVFCQPLSGAVVFTTLFTQYTDATGPKHTDPFAYIEPWYRSMHRTNMNGVVLYDKLSDQFISSHSSHNVIFRRSLNYIKRSPNDRRFYVYRDILQLETALTVCVFSDGRDVTFQKDVAGYIASETLLDTTRAAVFVGLDVKTIAAHNWLKRCDNGTFAQSQHGNSTLLNAGFLGCTRLVCLLFLRRVIEHLDRFQNKSNCNMLAFNMAVYELVAEGTVRMVTGPPLINRLWNRQRDDQVYVMHKGYIPATTRILHHSPVVPP